MESTPASKTVLVTGANRGLGTMTTHRIVPRQEWLAGRTALLEREKEHTRMGDELAQQRRELPWVPVEKQYTLQTAAGPKTLADCSTDAPSC